MGPVLRIITSKFVEVVYPVLKNYWGTIQHPYLTWKKVAREGKWMSTLVILALFCGYFAIREPVRWGSIQISGLELEEISGPAIGLWSRITILRFGMSVVTYLAMVVLMTALGLMIKKLSRPEIKEVYKHKLRVMFNVWIYSYLPTILWFAVAAGAFVVLPPPRHDTLNGLIFSVVFLAISCGLLAWKLVLYWLTLRIGLELTVKEVFWTTAVILPVILVYSWRLYELGLFKVPFI